MEEEIEVNCIEKNMFLSKVSISRFINIGDKLSESGKISKNNVQFFTGNIFQQKS